MAEPETDTISIPLPEVASVRLIRTPYTAFAPRCKASYFIIANAVLSASLAFSEYALDLMPKRSVMDDSKEEMGPVPKMQ